MADSSTDLEQRVQLLETHVADMYSDMLDVLTVIQIILESRKETMMGPLKPETYQEAMKLIEKYNNRTT